MAILEARKAALYAVAKRRSVETLLIEASARSRAMTVRMPAISLFDVLCGVTSWLASNCFQVTLFTFHKQKIVLNDRRQKVVALCHFIAKLIH